MDLNGASVIVTGGASGIGAGTARAVAALGARVVVCDLNEQGNDIASELNGTFVKTDVSDATQVQAAIDTAQTLAPIRGLVNSAGISVPARTVGRDGEPFPLDKFEFVLRVNLIGTFNCIRLVASAMSKQESIDADGQRGAIVNMASVAAMDGQIGQAAYSASKGGIVGMTLPIARDLSSSGIRVNTIAPGLIKTDFAKALWEDPVKRASVEAQYPLRRIGEPDDIAGTAIFLAADAGRYITGQTIVVDGGSTIAVNGI
jgi:NAD(P)-dependent dehydrogenase (short-subunit alcohol dehydrogenase family)